MFCVCLQNNLQELVEISQDPFVKRHDDFNIYLKYFLNSGETFQELERGLSGGKCILVEIQLPSLHLTDRRISLWSVIDKDVCVLSGWWVSTEAVEV